MGLLSRCYGWLVLPVLLLLNLLYSQRVLNLGGLHLTVFALVALALVIVGLALSPALPGRGALWQQSKWLVCSFMVLLVWLAISGIGRQRLISLPEIGFPMTELPTWVAYIPLAEAALALAAAWLMVAALRGEDIKAGLFWFVLAMLICGVIGQYRALGRSDQGGSSRLSTGLGGAAVLPVVMILVLAAAIGLAMVGYRRLWSGLFAVGAFVELVLTGSRSGLGMAGLFLVLAVVAWWFRGEPSRKQRIVALVLVLLAIATAVVLVVALPELARVVNLSDPARANNLQMGWRLASSSPQTLIFGVGSGVIWPWYAIDAGLIPFDSTPTGAIAVPGIDGHVLSSAHSVYGGILVEGGLVGFALLLIPIVLLLRKTYRARKDPLAGTLLLGLVATLLAFFFDTYLVKNFALAWVWWLALFVSLRLFRDADARAGTE